MKISRMMTWLFLLSAGLAIEAGAGETVRLVTNEWLPYMSRADNGVLTEADMEECTEAHGILSCVVAAAFSLEGIAVEYHSLPQARAYSQAIAGNYHGAVGWNHTPEREQAFHYSDLLMRKRRYFFHLKSYPFDWSSMEDLHGVAIGGDITTNYPEAFMEAEKNGRISVQRVPHKILNFKKLLSGRIQIYPVTVASAYKFLNEHFPPEQVQLFTYHPRVFHDATWHLILTRKNKQNTRYLKMFNRGLERLKASGRYDRYFTRTRGDG